MRYLSSLALFSLPLLLPSTAVAQNAAAKVLSDVETMAGISRMSVTISDIPTLADKLPGATLKSAAEQRFRQAGITVASGDDVTLPRVFINVTAMKPDEHGVFPFSVTVSFGRFLLVPGADKTLVYAFGRTWVRSGVATTKGDIRFIRQCVDDQVTEFLNAYLSVNPTRQ